MDLFTFQRELSIQRADNWSCLYLIISYIIFSFILTLSCHATKTNDNLDTVCFRGSITVNVFPFLLVILQYKKHQSQLLFTTFHKSHLHPCHVDLFAEAKFRVLTSLVLLPLSRDRIYKYPLWS